MGYLKIATIFFFVALLAGCSHMRGVKLFAPESFGLMLIAPSLYVETSADELTRKKLQEAMENAENAIRNTYGSVKSRPVINVCLSDACYKSLGGSSGTVGSSFIFLNRVLLHPHGMNWHFIAHEWSHRELLSRLSLSAWRRTPTWFDEGVAVTVSQAPEHAENHWQFLISSKIPLPTRQELLSLQSLQHWNEAIHRFGEDKNMERRAKGEPLINPVYAAAGHEIRQWLARVGSVGLLAFLERIDNGENFDSAYQTTKPSLSSQTPKSP